MSYRIIPYRARYFTGLVQLLDQAFTIQNDEKDALVKWKFFSPLFHKKTVSYVAVSEKDEVVAQYTNIPVTVRRKAVTYAASLCVDMATHVDHRRRGLISLLSAKVYKKIQQQGTQFSIGFSNAAGVMVDKHAKEYGYQVVGTFVRYYTWCQLASRKAVLLERVTSFDLLRPTEVSSPFFRLEKTNAFLTWRYLKKPNVSYEIYRFQEGKLGGYVVVSFQKRRCYVYDIVTNARTNEWKRIVRGIENLAVERGVKIVIFHVLDNCFWRELLAPGYWCNRSAKRRTFFTVHPHQKAPSSKKLLNPDEWLVMNGDIL